MTMTVAATGYAADNAPDARGFISLDRARGTYRLYDGCISGNLAEAELAIMDGADVNNQGPTTGYTLLHYVSSRGQLDMCQLLITRGADLTLRTATGETALDLARTPEMRALLKKEELWMKQILPLWMASDDAPSNLLRSIPQDAARTIISMLR